MLDVAIIDYQINNLHSVQAACRHAGMRSAITNNFTEIHNAKAVILPGVGAFAKAIEELKRTGLDQCIRDFIDSGRPFLGICLGFQLLYDYSEEFGRNEGLGLVAGHVTRITPTHSATDRCPVPHVGWNALVRVSDSWQTTLLANNTDHALMYFVHSYCVIPKNDKFVLSHTTYGNQTFCTAIQKNNIFGAQFHPEKSGPVGLKVYQTLKSKISD